MVPFQTADQKTQQLIDAVREHADREIAAKDMVSAAAEAMHQSFFGVGTAMHSMHAWRYLYLHFTQRHSCVLGPIDPLL